MTSLFIWVWGIFLFCLSDCIHKGKIAKKRAKGKSRSAVQEGKYYSREAWCIGSERPFPSTGDFLKNVSVRVYQRNGKGRADTLWGSDRRMYIFFPLYQVVLSFPRSAGEVPAQNVSQRDSDWKSFSLLLPCSTGHLSEEHSEDMHLDKHTTRHRHSNVLEPKCIFVYCRW